MTKSFTSCAESPFMMCQRIGRPPISTIGFGLATVSSLIREPRPPAKITAFMPALRDGFAIRRRVPHPGLEPHPRPLGGLGVALAAVVAAREVVLEVER